MKSEQQKQLERAVASATKGPSKFKNVEKRAGGFVHASQKQAYRWLELVGMEQRGEIRNLCREVDFKIQIDDATVCTYRADHVYERKDKLAPGADLLGRTEIWAPVVEDVKGKRTAVYVLKKKLMLAALGIAILEI